jgi:hypothetical protein
MVVVNHLMEVKAESAGMMEMMKVAMVVSAAAAAAVQIIWVPAAAAAILVVAVIMVAVHTMELEVAEVPIMEDLIQPTLQDPLQNGVITVRLLLRLINYPSIEKNYYYSNLIYFLGNTRPGGIAYISGGTICFFWTILI